MPGTGVSPPGPEDGADEEASSVCRPGVASTVAAGISDPSVPAVSSGLAGTDFESLSLAWATAPVGGSCSSGASAEGPKTPAAVCASSAAAFAASSCRLGLPQSFMTLISAGYCDSPGGGHSRNPGKLPPSPQEGRISRIPCKHRRAQVCSDHHEAHAHHHRPPIQAPPLSYFRMPHPTKSGPRIHQVQEPKNRRLWIQKTSRTRRRDATCDVPRGVKGSKKKTFAAIPGK